METMEESSKTLVRYHFLMDKTKVAHGDAKRTAEGFANQMKALDADVKNASTTLGNKLLLETTKWLVLMRNILAEFTKIESVADKIISASSTIRNFTTGAMAMQGTGLTGMIAGGLVGAQRGEDIRAPSDNIDRGKGHWDRRTGKWVSDESMFQGEEGQRGGLNQNDIKEKAKQQENDKFNRTQSMLDEYSKKSASEFWRRQEEQDRDGELQLAKDREQADKQRDLEAQLYEADLAETAALLKRDRDATEKQDNEERDWRENQN
jgi:hypothetical protein